MDITCKKCGYKSAVNTKTVRGLIGGSLIGASVLGWFNYVFAGLLWFNGGALLIASALLAGGGAILLGKDFGLVVKVGEKLASALGEMGLACSKCGAKKWKFSGTQGLEVISGSEHRDALYVGLEEAVSEVIIASGFLSAFVVNEEFAQLLGASLKRGVKVTLIFPDEPYGSVSHENGGYEEALKRLLRLANEYPKLNLIKRYTHQKALIVDERYAIVGSFNFLSNLKAARDETSAKIFDRKAISEIRKTLLEGGERRETHATHQRSNPSASNPKKVFSNKPSKCPNCGSVAIAEIVYGYIDEDEELERQFREGKIVFGGCSTTDEHPYWRCKNCSHEIQNVHTNSRKRDFQLQF